VPGLAKTLLVQSVAEALHGSFQRIQFTPDLLPSDVVGTVVYLEESRTFIASPGPIFANLVLADEINRAPPKVQSALLEAMEERQVTLGRETHPLPDPFMVLATQNPVEQHGTYPLAEAQLDRFMMMVRVGYPTETEETMILAAATGGPQPGIDPVVTRDELEEARGEVEGVRVDPRMLDYVVAIVRATREPTLAGLPELEHLIDLGASPRAGVCLAKCARTWAYLEGRSFVLPEDVKKVAHDVLRHRVALTFEAEAQDLTSDSILDQILSVLPIP
jgi:MoxR-like ATPase